MQDLKGLKMRFFGLGAQGDGQARRGDPAARARATSSRRCSSARIDATEFSLPVMDQKLGFHQVAKFYYFPGWHQQATFLEFYINANKWKSLVRPAQGDDRVGVRRPDARRDRRGRGDAVARR